MNLAKARFVALVREFAQNSPIGTLSIRYFTKPDERLDMTLASNRVYGNREEGITIMAAAGLDSVESILNEQLLVLPTLEQLLALKKKAGINRPVG